MCISVKNIDLNGSKFDCDQVTLFPVNYYESEDRYQYSSTAISFWKYANKKMVIDILTEPENLLEQRSGEWYGPEILLTSSLIIQNPQVISILCGVLSNYLTDFFKGMSKPKVRLRVLYKETKNSKTSEISYEGDISGIDKLETSIIKIVDQGNNFE